MKKIATCIASLAVASTCAFGPAAVASADDTSPTTTTSTSTAPETSLQAKVDALLARSTFPADVQDKLRALVAKLPADADQRAAAARDRLGIDSPFQEIARSVINPEDYQCASTPLTDWLNEQLTIQDLIPIFFIGLFGGLDLPVYDSVFYGVESKANKFGVNGEYTSLLTAEMTDLRRFWDVDGTQVRLVPMKASVLQNRDRMIAIYTRILGDAPIAETFTDIVLAIVGVFPNVLKNPFITFNAFAIDPTGEPGLEGVTKLIAVGDGVLQGVQAIGLDKFAAPRAILAHEYGHQVQFAKGLFATDLPTQAERTRRTELMADAFGTYFMVHARGEALNAARTLDDEKAFYNVGDCNFGSDGHHGTPDQRFRTASWAVSVANGAADQGYKLKALDFAAKFDAKLPELVAPDAP